MLVAMAISVYEMMMMMQPRLDDLFRNYVRFDPKADAAKAQTSLEYDSAIRPVHYKRLAVLCVALASFLFLSTTLIEEDRSAGVIVFFVMLAMLSAVFATRGIEAEMARVCGIIVSIVYAGLPWIVIWYLYVDVPGARKLILTLAIVWLGDTGAYFGGRAFGKHKLAPNKSPKKTWEGAIAGLLSSVLAAFFVHKYYYTELPGGYVTAMFAALFGGLAGQMGDLVESVFKRFTLVKDSGKILPGHGGVLDRIDAVLFAAPVIWIILETARLLK